MARPSTPSRPGRGDTIIISGYRLGRYPYGSGYHLGFGYGGFGFGGYGFPGYYDPYYGYPGYYAAPAAIDGALRLKVSPNNATVYVDGYYAGRVDDFDGLFQRLHLEPGPHRIEIQADGYEPITFDVRILPDRTVTYTGELKKF